MDKNKIIEGASKLVAKGAYDKAIKEYQKVLEFDPTDIRILQKLGELHQKRNEPLLAADCFIRVAESYASDGFFLKAVALYKQALKLNPQLVEVNLRLAELHQQLQLLGEAMAYYQGVVAHYEKLGEVSSCIQVLRKMLELDADSVAARVKLAEMYVTENMVPDAVAEFTRAASLFRQQHRTDDYLRILERLSTIEPNNVSRTRELAESYLARGDHKRALVKIQEAMKLHSKDADLLRLLANAYLGLGQIGKTVTAFKELAKVYGDAGKRDEAERIWQQVAELDPNDADVQGRGKPLKTATGSQALPTAPSGVLQNSDSGAHQILNREHLRKLLNETDVYLKYGLFDKALEHLRKIFVVEPENLDAHEKAYEIYVASGHAEESKDQLLNVLRICARRQETQRAQPYLDALVQTQPKHPELPAFLAVLRSNAEPSSVENEVEDLSSMDDIPELEFQGEASSGDVEEQPELELSADDAEWVLDADAMVEPSQTSEVEVALADNVSEDTQVVFRAELADVAPELAASLPPQPHQEECDEADFFIQQGLWDEAREILETVLLAFPGHARAQALLSSLPSEEEQSEKTPVNELGWDVAEQPSGLMKELRAVDAATHFDLGLAYVEMGMLADALQEFQRAEEGMLAQPQEVELFSSIGAVLAKMGRLEEAAQQYRQACESRFATQEQAVKLRFELANTLESMGEFGKALFHFLQIQEMAPKSPLIDEHIARLSAMASPIEDWANPSESEAQEVADDDNLTSKTQRVSYV